jgi:hypothetical protein
MEGEAPPMNPPRGSLGGSGVVSVWSWGIDWSAPEPGERRGKRQTTLLFDTLDDSDVGGHRYLVVRPRGATWLTELADEYARLRAACRFPIDDVDVAGLDIFDADEIDRRIRAKTVPPRVGGNFDVLRSDFGETNAYLVLEGLFGTSFGYKSVQDRELVNLPGRGIDAIGVEAVDGTAVGLCLSETKVSSQALSPPAVVDGAADDSLRNQQIGHLTDHEATTRKLWEVARHARDPDQQTRFLTAALLFEEEAWDRLSLFAVCVLLRPASLDVDGDFGSFADTPGDYLPAKVRFIIIKVPVDSGSLEDLVTSFGDHARGGS